MRKKILEYYIDGKPPITLQENAHEIRDGKAKKLFAVFDVRPKIWLAEYLSSYRIAIPENLEVREGMLEHWKEIWPIETRFVEYVPTGRVIYDNSRAQSEAVVFEYVLKQMKESCSELIK